MKDIQENHLTLLDQALLDQGTVDSAKTQPFPHPDFSVFEARPREKKDIRAGLILIQEIFGVNQHIRQVARTYAELGFWVWAPSYFDHIEKGIELGYNTSTFEKGRAYAAQLGWEQAIQDSRIAATELRKILPTHAQKIASIGFCWGGGLSWLLSCRLGPEYFEACVSYYGRAAIEFREERPQSPIIMHFGQRDPLIPLLNVQSFQRAQPRVPVYVYEAGHGFNCEARTDYDAIAAAQAQETTLKFLTEVL
jgi:carboxymethylenebutenolidase